MKTWWERNKWFVVALVPVTALAFMAGSRQLIIFLSHAFAAE
ncbi:hypothetical protein [Schaalia canis]|nr:hypothetical protein [Schaalia canis]